MWSYTSISLTDMNSLIDVNSLTFIESVVDLKIHGKVQLHINKMAEMQVKCLCYCLKGTKVRCNWIRKSEIKCRSDFFSPFFEAPPSHLKFRGTEGGAPDTLWDELIRSLWAHLWIQTKSTLLFQQIVHKKGSASAACVLNTHGCTAAWLHGFQSDWATTDLHFLTLKLLGFLNPFLALDVRRYNEIQMAYILFNFLFRQEGVRGNQVSLIVQMRGIRSRRSKREHSLSLLMTKQNVVFG